MPVLDKNDPQEVRRFNDFVKNSIYGSAMQDVNWAKVKSDWDSEYIFIEKQGQIAGSISILFKKAFMNHTFAYAPRGPVCDINDCELVEELMREVDAVAKKHNAFLFRFDPFVDDSLEIRKKYMDMGFHVRKEGIDSKEFIQPIYNMVLSLKGEDEESLIKKFAEKTRYNIRLAQRKGVTVRFSRDDEDVKLFHDIYLITADRNEFGRRGLDYFIDMKNAFDSIRVYVAEFEGNPLSAAITLNYGGCVWYVYGGSNNVKRNFMPNYLMQWEMIKWAMETGAVKYDFGGLFELNNSDGLFKFKEGFCRKDGVTENIGEIDKVYNPLIYFAFTKLAPKAKKLVKSVRGLVRR